MKVSEKQAYRFAVPPVELGRGRNVNLAPAYHVLILIEIAVWRLLTSNYFCKDRRIALTKINRGK